MTELILHHYATSPFSEKVRLILGYKDQPWKSVTVPVILPKPDVMPLTGGYRRTPFLQIGADIYCDTALIAQVLESIHPVPTLYPADRAAAAFAMAQWADTTLFWAAASFVGQPEGIKSLMAGLPEDFVKAFVEDRKAMRAGGTGLRTPLPEAVATLQVFLAQLERQFATGEHIFLFGEQPTIADFSVYHALWFIRRATAVAGILDAHPAAVAWMHRMAGFGHAQAQPMTPAEALDIARAATPRALTDTGAGADFDARYGLPKGTRVTVAATDYAVDPVEGDLVVSTRDALGVLREDPRVGQVVVHFPRVGYAVRKVEPAG
ncbi:glutathione S-transferase family protein [Ralstonia solanacearum]|uniref:glutathione S-transferase family protein n=1 Tax=Ralstonia solanacearum TaxID=305 RepID=UPI0007D82A5C|nr:glutathione S-transferase family protein [Ralstonia solanacearum]AST32305.2 glutathione S-transferase family protein [Ralstonia solanacearum]MDB0509332.1 glutathione S-transferase family protein [Ralstonia solanacearum]MDB0515263.1 glutathione S-transferase family protein [Ralstonia solanacearum]MDB0567050.1 glutathione S-transferase family protein [Ralstonia solanacearum]MDB0576511.1 glutathione S-transferase family protein [Ralstonia solanacearum]